MAETDRLAGWLHQRADWLCAGLLLAGCLFWIAASRLPVEQLVTELPDDAGYFLTIGERLAAGDGLTFDGLHRTNGVQPLWQLMVAGFCKLTPNDPVVRLRGILVLQAGLLLLATLAIYDVLRTTRSPSSALLGVLAMQALIWPRAINGMETAVFVCCLAMLVRTAVSEPPEAWRPARAVAVGIWLGLTFLARLDSAFLVFAVGCWLLICAVRRPAARPAALMAVLAAAMLALPYLLYNKLGFGSIMPVSGALKSSPVAEWWAVPEHWGWLGRVAQAAVLLSVACCVAWLAWPGWRRDRWLSALAFLSIGVLGHTAHTLLYMRWAVFTWHFILYVFLLALAVPVLIGGLSEKPGRASLATILAMLLLALAVRQHLGWVRRAGRVDESWHAAACRAGYWASVRTAPDARLAMKDAGWFGYFSRRKVINLDGLVNAMELQSVLRDGRLAEYLTANQVDYLVQHAFLTGDTNLPMEGSDAAAVNSGEYETLGLRYRSQLYLSYSDPQWLRRADEAYRSEPFDDDGEATQLLIWRRPR